MKDLPLTFYTHPMSRGRTIRWMLEETGLAYREVVLDLDVGVKTPEYLAINPMGKVPAIQHGQTVITETAAICAYLAELVPDKGLAPAAGSVERGPYYRWLFFMAGPVESMVTARQAGAMAPARSAGYGTEANVLRTLEEAVGRSHYLVADRFTAADLVMAAYLSYFMAFGVLEARPGFVEYAQRHTQRAAALAANARDDALLPANVAARGA